MTDAACAAPDGFVAAAQDRLGDRGFTRDPDLIAPWLTDWRGRYTGRAVAMASPASTTEVAAIVRLCAEYGVPIVPQGGNSGMVGGATPDRSGTALLLSLRRMQAIRRFDRAARQIVVDAGLVLQTLHETVAAEGLRFPLTLGGKGSATIGGLVSTNAGGTQVLRHGTMRAQVLGLEAVLADGSVFDALTTLKKDNRGFDLKQVLIGSEGTLGIVTGATLRLLPAIGGRVVAWAGVASPQAARALLLALEEAVGDALEGFEILPAHSLDAVLAYEPRARSPLGTSHAWHVLAEAVFPRSSTGDGTDDNGGDGAALRHAIETTLAEAIARDEVADAVIATNESQAEAFWALRDGIASAERAIGPAMQHDISVPVTVMPDFITSAAPALERAFPGTRAVAFGHLGDGNLHFHVLAPPGADRTEWEAGEGAAISRRVYDMVHEAGGSISAEHGIGQGKTAELERLGDPVALALQRSIKRALDPENLLNPGKLVRVAPNGATD